MKSEKGQALVEFILLVPILAIFIMGLFDVGNLIYKKYQLENDLDYVVDLYQSGNLENINTYLLQKNISVTYDTNISYTTITITKSFSFVTPGLNKVFGSTYSTKVERTIFNES